MELSSLLNPETEDERRDHSAERWDDPEGPPPPGGSGSQGTPVTGRKYPCKVCERVFTTSGHLSRHMKVHTGERKYVCPFPGCDVKCNRSDNLLQHYRVHLPKEERKLGNSHIRESLRRMNSYASSSSSTGQISPGVSEPQEFAHTPSHSPTIVQHGPSLPPQHASTSHYPVPAHYTTANYPTTSQAPPPMHLVPPPQRSPHQPQQRQGYANPHYVQSLTQEPRSYHSDRQDEDDDEDEASSSGSDEEDNDEEEDDEEDEPPQPSTSAGASRQGGFPVSSSRYEGR